MCVCKEEKMRVLCIPSKKLHCTVQYSVVESYTRCIYLVTKRVFSILLRKSLKYVEESDINDEILLHSGYCIIKEKNY
ncbi:hypothetical protein BCR42DRAFT_405484 [Absidia repens]|uniref:Uncharacterized protein n=1 Tax=Absidia repens TaxID=90262 RepID=A0A1X2IV53_9FUNG|nr:hypothetical protein BCR42DRAFT_405484 [Absidia repens]